MKVTGQNIEKICKHMISTMDNEERFFNIIIAMTMKVALSSSVQMARESMKMVLSDITLVKMIKEVCLPWAEHRKEQKYITTPSIYRTIQRDRKSTRLK